MLAVAEESLFAHVAVLNVVELLRQLLKVVPDLAVDLTTVYQHDELRFNARIEVQLDFRLRVAVDSDVVKVGVLSAQTFIVWLNFVTSRVPLGCEVQAGVHGFRFVHVLD